MADRDPATPETKTKQTRVHRRPRGTLTVKKVIEALQASSGIRAHAAEMLKVNRATITRFAEKHPEVVEAEAEIIDGISDIAVSNVVKGVMKGEWAQTKYWLDHKGQSAGFGVRKLAFEDGGGSFAVAGVLVVPKIEEDADQWARRHAEPLALPPP